VHNLKKKGFIFVETVVVLVVVMLSLTLALATYSLITRRSKVKVYYNNASDLYLLYTLSNLGTNTAQNYSTLSSSTFFVNENNCKDKLTFISDSCAELFNDFNINTLGVVTNVSDLLNNSDNSNNDINADFILFLETLKMYNYDASTKKSTPRKYLVASIYRNKEYYYAAVEIEG